MPELNGRHLSEEQLVWHYYGEEDSAEVDLHLEVCRECRASFETLKVSMKAIESFAEPARSADYGAEVWRALVKRHAPIANRAPWWKRWISPRPLAWAGALSALVLAAFLAGRVTQPPREVAVAPEVASERILAAALSDHFERSERVLLEIEHLDRPTGLADSRPRAEELLAANRLYRLTAERQGQEALAGVLDDLERVLLDVAHAPEKLSDREMSGLRARVDDQELLFKLRVLGERLRQTNLARKG